MNYHLKWTWVLVINILTFCNLFSQSPLSPEKQKQLDAFAEKLLKEWNIPSIGLGIVSYGEVVLAKSYGYRNIEKKLKADKNTLYGIGSATKAFTAVGISQLSDQKIINLDTPIINYLPDFRLSDNYLTHHLSVRDLLCHRSGLPRHDLIWEGAFDDRKTLYSKLRYLETSAGIREKFQYQNLMYMVAGYLIGQLRNSTWEAEMKKRIFDPLEMTRTNCSVEISKKDENHALAYVEEEGKLKNIPLGNLDAIGPAMSINSSPMDMCNWLIVQMQSGTFKQKHIMTWQATQQNQSSVIAVPEGYSSSFGFDNGHGPISYGLGWNISNHKGRRILEHGGTITGFKSTVAFIPWEGLGVVVLVNKSGSDVPQIMRNYVLDIMLNEEPRDWNTEFHKSKEFEKAAIESFEKREKERQKKEYKPGHNLMDYVGKYEHEAYGTIVISQKESQLIHTYKDESSTLKHHYHDVFYYKQKYRNLKVNFRSTPYGKIDQLSIPLESKVSDIVFKRIPNIIPLTAQSIAPYLGEYELKDGNFLKLWKKGEKTLMITFPGQPSNTLVQVEENKFHLDGWNAHVISFEKKGDEIIGINLGKLNGIEIAKKRKANFD